MDVQTSFTTGIGDNLGGSRRRRKGRKGRARRTCRPDGVKANGTLRQGFRWAKGRKHCAIPAKR